MASPEINKDLDFPLKGSVSHLANSMQALVPLFRMSFMSWQGLMRLKHVCSSQLLRHCQQFRREHLKKTNSNDQTINTNAYNMFLIRLLANITFSLYTLTIQFNSSEKMTMTMNNNFISVSFHSSLTRTLGDLFKLESARPKLRHSH